ncbi:efflux RND transporter periplasmic adaptor subunit [Prolixibacteraceae bacterium]|nr:efflux RND transporter periplasmic adaptor subunit [Prolixibacteraceae bacterium]
MKKIYIIIITTLVLGILIGRQFKSSEVIHNHKHDTTHSEKKQSKDIWTCSMHPQIRQDHPGDCPICGMDLIKLVEDNQSDSVNEDQISLSPASLKQAQVETFKVSMMKPIKTLSLSGRIVSNPEIDKTQSIHVSGRVEKLHVTYPGQYIKKGQTIALFYAPELITAQRELIESENQPLLKKAAMAKLKQWKISNRIINKIIQNRTIIENFPIQSEYAGYITRIAVKDGDYLKEGQKLFELNDYSTVWALFDTYNQDQKWLHIGDTVEFHSNAYLGESQTAKISFISPEADHMSHTSYVRIKLKNRDNRWKPNMFIEGQIKSKAKQPVLSIPETAVLWTGKHSVIYVEKSIGNYIPRTITIGNKYDHYYQVLNGLNMGENVVMKGTFTIDASAELSHKHSMLNPPKGTHQMTNNNHQSHKMKMKTITMKVSGNCGMCKTTIETAANSLKGVHHAEWSKETKELTLHYMPKMVTLDQIEKAIAAKGYDTPNHIADKNIYNALPACCHYRN